jgi:hypothetical protein
MRRGATARGLLVSTSGLVLALACGSRSELLPGRVVGSAGTGAGGTEMLQPPEPECLTAQDCLQPAAGECGVASCIDGMCSLVVDQICDDANPCTKDSCLSGVCSFVDDRVDQDGDGVFARGSSADPQAAFGCGNDCDDSASDIYPGALELCDSFDNDCNGVVDDGTSLQPSALAPVRVSPLNAVTSGPGGLAFDGNGFGATMTTELTSKQGQFRQLDVAGKPLADPLRVAHVNAESYGGPLVWSGERYMTAYYDARQGGNYEIYLDVLNRKGERLFDDLRVTNAAEFSLRPSIVWTGAESLIVWEDHRFEDNGEESVVFGQRVSPDGKLIGANQRLSPPGLQAERVSMALSDGGVGIAFLSLDASDQTHIRFMTASRALEQVSLPSVIDFTDPDGPVVTAVGDKYVVTFHQDNSLVIGPSIFGVVLDRQGNVELGPRSMTAGAQHARGNATYSYGDRFVMVWADDTDGPYQLYAQTFDKKLAPVSPRVRLISSSGNALGAQLAASSDGGLGVLYNDDSTGRYQTYFTRLDCLPRPLGLK